MNISTSDPARLVAPEDRVAAAAVEQSNTERSDGRAKRASEDAQASRAAKTDESGEAGGGNAAPKAIQLPEFRHTDLLFRIEEELGRVVIQVIDSKTGDVLRSIPPEELVRLAKQFRATRGVLLDKEG